MSDGTNDASLESFNLTVVNTNDIPTISGTPVSIALQDQAYLFLPTADDVDVDDTLTFDIVNKPVWAVFDTGTGKLSGTPSADDIGTTSGIVISVTDSHSAPVPLGTFSILVKSSNTSPTIGGTPAESVDEDSGYLFEPSFNDPDGDTLIFSIVNKPVWASFSSTTGVLSGTPLNENVGTTSGIIIRVSDGIAEPVSLPVFNITVNNTNDIPTISGTPSTVTQEDAYYSFMPASGDDDTSDTLSFSIANKPSWHLSAFLQVN